MGPTFLFPFAKKKELPNFLIPPLRGYISPPFLSRHSVFRRPSCENRRCRLWDPQSHCSAASPHRSAQSHAIPDRWPPGGEGRLEVFSGFGGRLLFFFRRRETGGKRVFRNGARWVFRGAVSFWRKKRIQLKINPQRSNIMEILDGKNDVIFRISNFWGWKFSGEPAVRFRWELSLVSIRRVQKMPF